MLFKTALSLVRVISSEMIIVLTKSENSPWKINSSNSIVSNNIPFSSKNLKKVSLVTILVNSLGGRFSLRVTFVQLPGLIESSPDNS